MKIPPIDLSFIWHHKTPQEMVSIGSVADIIEGHVPASLKNKILSARNFAHGFMVGSPDSLTSLGETVITNGICFTHDTSSKARGLIYDEHFTSSALFAIPHSAQANLNVIKKNDHSCLSMTALNQHIFEEVDHTFAYVGTVHFSELQLIQIQKPPINSENIFEHAQKYYPEPPILHTNQTCFMIGVASPTGKKVDKKLLAHLRTVLYEKDEKNKVSSLTMHAHGLLLRDEKAKALTAPSNVIDVGHIVFADSMITLLDLQVYLIEDIKKD